MVIAAEEDGSGIGRIRMAIVPKRTRKNLHGFVQEMIEIGSVVHTDGFHVYRGIDAFGYKHRQTVISRQKEKKHRIYCCLVFIAS